MPELKGRVALVTGAGHGIGLEYAGRLAEEGATAVLADLDGAAVAGAVEGLLEKGLNVAGAVLDISEPDSCVELLNSVVSTHGRIDILINNAAIYRESGFALAEELDLHAWQRLIDVNISGTFYMCRAAIPHMKSQHWGRIINQSSTSAYTTVPRSLHYSMSKAAISTMTKTLARELGPFGITVNAVAPGMVDTDATRSVVPSEVLEGAAEHTSLKRVGQVEDLSPLVSFLCSNGAGYITGQTIVVDGGVVMTG